MKKNQYMLVLAALLIGAVSFFAGTRYQLSNKGNNLSESAMGNGVAQGQRGQQVIQQGNAKMGQNNLQGGGMVSGEIASKDGQSLTVKMSDGSTKIVIVADSTSYKKSTDAVAADLIVGENVTVIGTTNTDGSVTAKTVTVGDTAMPIGQGRPENLPSDTK